MNTTPEQAKEISIIIDEQIKINGLEPIQKGQSRFEFITSIFHQTQRRFAYTNSYAVIWQDWLMVFADQDTKIFNISEIIEYSMMNRNKENQTIPVVKVVNKKIEI